MTASWSRTRSGFLSSPPSPAVARRVTICPSPSRVLDHAERGTGRPSIAVSMLGACTLPLRCLSVHAPGSASATRSASVAPGGTTAGRVSRPSAVSGCGQMSAVILGALKQRSGSALEEPAPGD